MRQLRSLLISNELVKEIEEAQGAVFIARRGGRPACPGLSFNGENTFGGAIHAIRRYDRTDVMKGVRIVDERFPLKVLGNNLQMGSAHLPPVLACDAATVNAV